jgi:DNA repair protein RecN (Recombination protein N)
MLSELLIREFALIDEASLSLAPGMTVFTGETGAGKSILVDALGAAFGARASQDWVRFGASQAEIVATLGCDDPRLITLLAEQAIEADEALILRRVIKADGKSSAYVNGTPAPVRLLQQIGDLVLDLHGQHEHQALLRPDFQRQLIDARLPGDLRQAVAEAHGRWRQAGERLQALLAKRSDTGRQEQWMRDELARLAEIGIEEGLAQTLQAEVDQGRHFAQIQEAAANATALVEDGEPDARALLAGARHALAEVVDYQSELQEAMELLDQTDALLGEVAYRLRHALDSSFDEQALRAAETRLMDLHDAMRRHQADDEAGLLALMRQWEEVLSRLDTAGWDEDGLRAELAAAAAAYQQAAAALSEARRQAAAALAKELRPFLDRLALKGMQVRIDVEPHAEEAAWSDQGLDTVRFMASSNPGEPFRELAAIASGGEMSRFVLALKGCGALAQAPHVAVFDEVDVGIGGETAWCVGELLAAMGRERQVLVVSHLPQVAACAQHQVRIQKLEGERTVTRVALLPEEERLDEIARMLGGADSQSRAHAVQMLARGQGLAA